MGATSRSLGNLSWPDIAASEPQILAIPIGSCEQHGPHLPLDTDARIAVAVATGLATTTTQVLVGPTISVSASGEHQGFAGTLSLGLETTARVIVELVRSADWSAGVVLVNGHGGNAVAVSRAVTLLHQEGRRVLSWWPIIPGADGHAGRTETSLMLAIDPTAVQLAKAAAGRTEPVGELLSQLRREGVVGVSPNGVLGDPAGATSAEGQRILEALVLDLVARVTTWRQ